MSDPTTGYENHGGWSSLAEERAYLRELDQRPGVSVREAGRSVLGNSLWCVDLGNPAGPTLLVVGGVHGRELSGREAALIWARTLSTAGDSAVAAYLAAHRVVIVPTANPDGAAMFARDNANGVNLNRDYAQLIQPETRAVKRVINDVRPQIILDLHDVDASLDEGFDFRPYAGGMPGIVPELQQAATACLDEAKAATGVAGFTSKDYNTAMVPYASLSVIAAAFHAVGILSETSFRLRHPDRIEVATLMLEAVRKYHAEHQADLVAAVAESKRAAREATGDLVLCTGSFVTTGVQRPDPAYFDVPEGFAQELAELQGITVEDRVFGEWSRWLGDPNASPSVLMDGTMEVRRNLARQTVVTDMQLSYRSQGLANIAADSERVRPGRSRSLKVTTRDGWTSTPGATQHRALNGGPDSSGKAAPGERVGIWVWVPAGKSIRFGIAELTPSGGVLGARLSSAPIVQGGDSWQWVEGVTDVPKTSADNTLVAWTYAVAVDNGNSNSVFSWWMSDPLNQPDAKPGPQFDGDSPGGDPSRVPSISTRQAARSLIAALFHPDAYQNIVGKEWPPDPVTPDPSPAGSFSLSVKQGGVIRRVREVWVKRDGVRRRVRSAVVKQGGVRRSL